MKICVVGTIAPLDEARKVIAYNVMSALAQRSQVLFFDQQSLLSRQEWESLKAFNPDIIHSMTAASPFSLFLLRILQKICPNSKSVILSPLLPFRDFSHDVWFTASSLLEPLVPLLTPDLILAQSKNAEITYRRLGCRVLPFVYSGVDLQKFRPSTQEEKGELRTRYNIPSDKYIVLHIGSIKKRRNVECLKMIQEDDENQVIVVGRRSYSYEPPIEIALKEAGIIVANTYTPSIEDFYRLSDCYVFPTTDPAGSIDIPLSVLEAMASGLPVISTRFGGLPQIFEGSGGFLYSEVEKFADTLKVLKSSTSAVSTRELVEPYSWERIAQNLLQIYEKIQEGTM